jgi:hypothetical protein
MQTVGLDSYLYCPKSDAFLRKHWQQEWPRADWEQLVAMARHYRDSGLNWGVGLSPYALYQDYSARNRDLLRHKLEQINSLGGNLLAVLFDDMPGDCPDLARIQAEIVNDIQHWSESQQLLVCPTYYSFDPVLERFFGDRPQHYWADLGSQLPEQAHILWTGNEVCSPAITIADAQAATAALGRKPILWDNYPVNDGEKASKYMHMKPLPDRDSRLGNVLSGHFCNPMNQALLSRYPLVGLARLYGHGGAELEDLYSEDLCRQLRRDMDLFQSGGLDAINEEDRQKLSGIYRGIPDPAALEVADWLVGGYRFDPACLTG